MRTYALSREICVRTYVGNTIVLRGEKEIAEKPSCSSSCEETMGKAHSEATERDSAGTGAQTVGDETGMTLVWDDTSVARCPKCGSTVAVGIMSLAATCGCGAYYADINEARGWYASREAYERGDARIDATTTPGPSSGT